MSTEEPIRLSKDQTMKLLGGKRKSSYKSFDKVSPDLIAAALSEARNKKLKLAKENLAKEVENKKQQEECRNFIQARIAAQRLKYIQKQAERNKLDVESNNNDKDNTSSIVDRTIHSAAK